MIKNILKIFLALIIAGIIILVIISASRSIYITSANNNFKKGKYETAAKQYEKLIKIDPKNNTYKIKLADSLVKLPFDYDTQKRICDFLEKYEGNQYTYVLEEKLKKYKADLDLRIGANYIEKAPLNNQILRWEDDAFPLKVYISGGNNEYREAVKKAFDYWTYTTKNFFSFAYTDNMNKADVYVEIVGEAKANCTGEGCYYVAALTNPEIKNNILIHMNMTIYSSDPNGNVILPEKVYRTTLHEIGHVLGIMGHSDNPGNLMYASGRHDEFEDYSKHTSVLSAQDINTLDYLYMIVPNISNVSKDKHITENKIHPNVILGTSRQIKERDIQNALNYISKAPNLAVGYLDLGNAYVQNEQYSNALQTYKQGFELSVDKQEKYLFVYNMATTCIKMKNRDKALEYAEYAKKLNPTDEINHLIHDIKYPLGLSEPEY